MTASLVVVNGRIWPGPPGLTALAVAGDRILATGVDGEIRGLVGPGTTLVDAGGGLVLPGFNDAHVHFLMGARSLRNLELAEETTVAGIQRRIGAFARAHLDRDWLLGRGWFYSVFPGGMPHRDLLDGVVSDRPVAIEAYDSHTTWVNTAALARLRIGDDTANPPRGEIQRDDAGHATGILKEAAMELVNEALPRPPVSQDVESLAAAAQLAHQHGLTSVQEAGAGLEQFEIYEALRRDGSPMVRIRLGQMMEPGHSIAAWERRLGEYARVALPHRGDAWTSAGIVKAFADGVIETGTASMLAPYEGMQANDEGALGYPQWEPGELREAVRVADAAGWQVQIHAVGDGAVRMALDAYESAAARNGPGNRRHRIEHIEAVDPADIPRFRSLGVVASMQPYHAHPDPAQMQVYRSKIGTDRLSRGWPWNSIGRAGGRLAFGSDWPIVTFNPFSGIDSAVHRRLKNGQAPGSWLPQERITLEQALAGYTSGSAWAAHEDTIKGRLEAGQLADVVVLDRDLFSVQPSDLLNTSVRATILGGRLVYERNSATSR